MREQAIKELIQKNKEREGAVYINKGSVEK